MGRARLFANTPSVARLPWSEVGSGPEMRLTVPVASSKGSRTGRGEIVGEHPEMHTPSRRFMVDPKWECWMASRDQALLPVSRRPAHGHRIGSRPPNRRTAQAVVRPSVTDERHETMTTNDGNFTREAALYGFVLVVTLPVSNS
jgi:hypothetical protein